MILRRRSRRRGDESKKREATREQLCSLSTRETQISATVHSEQQHMMPVVG